MAERGIQNMNMSGNLASNWKFWRQKFENYIIATEIDKKPDKTQCAQLLHLIGDEGLRIYNTFDASEIIDLKTLLNKFEQHFLPRKNVEFERYKFFCRKQTEGESLEHYVTDLKNQALNCEFGTLKDDLVKSIFICGVQSEALRENLLQLEDKKLESVIKIAQTYEESREQAKIMKSVNSQNHVEIDYISNNNKNQNAKKEQCSNSCDYNNSYSMQNFKKCYRCGLKHERNKCPAFNLVCNKCNIKGHYASQCRTKRKIRSLELTNPDLEDNHEDNLNKYFIDKINSDSYKQEWQAILLLENRLQHNFKLDTGAMANIINSKVISELGIQSRSLNKTKQRLTTYTGQNLRTLGKIKLNVRYKNQNADLEFFVIDTNSPSILGLEGCTKLDIIRKVNNINCGSLMKSKEILNEYPEVFEGIGCLNKNHHITIDKNVHPCVHPPRKIPFPLQEIFKKTLDQMEKDKIIKKVEEPTEWVNSIVIVRKPDNTLRICLDPSDLNKAIKREHFKLPTLEEISSKFIGKKFFTTLDCVSGFWAVPLDDSSSYLCTFNAGPHGRYRFLRLPYGIKSASEVFHKTLNKIFDIPGVSVYIDDLIIYAESMEQHDAILKQVLETALANNIKFNKSKCKIAHEEITFLGHKFSEEGMQIDEERIQSIIKYPTPSNKKELEIFLGIINYVGKYIPNLSEISFPLRQLIKKDSIFLWNSNCENAMKKTKALLMKAPTLQFFDNNKESTISVDASQNGLGAVLLQNGKPCAYASKSLTETQKRYAVIEKELLGIVYGCEKFEQYILGKRSTIETDHKPLIDIFKKPLYQCPLRLQRMLIRLQRYDIQLKYVPGKEMYIADALSRMDVPNNKDIMFDKTIEKDLAAQVCILNINMIEENVKLEEIAEETKTDQDFYMLKTYINQGWPKEYQEIPDTLKPFKKYSEELTVVDDILYKSNKIIVPKTLRRKILKILHYSHQGILRTKMRARENFFWPGLNKEIEDLVISCNICSTYQNSNQREPMIMSEIPERPWQKIACDLFSLKSATYLLVVDYYSKYVEVEKLTRLDSEAVIAHLKIIFSRYGVPEIVLSDGGPQFSSMQFKKFAGNWNFKHLKSSPTYAQANGLAERSIQTVKRIMLKAVEDNKDIFMALLQFRNTPMEGLGSPAQLLFGRRLRDNVPSPVQLLNPRTINPSQVKNILKQKQQMQKNYYDRGVKSMKPLQDCENVRFQSNGKWKKGQVIKRAEGPRSYYVQTETGTLLRNRKFLKPITDNQEIEDRSSQTDEDEDPLDDSISSEPRYSPQPVTRSGRNVKRRILLDL